MAATWIVTGAIHAADTSKADPSTPRTTQAQTGAANASADAGDDDAARTTHRLLQQRQGQETGGRPIHPNPPAGGEGGDGARGEQASGDTWDTAVLGPRPGQTAPRLLREGTFIVSHTGRLIRPQGRPEPVFVFDNPKGKPPLGPVVLLPCRYVQSMEDAVQRSDTPIDFTVSGQVTAFRGVNYLLVTALTGVHTEPNDPTSPPAASGAASRAESEPAAGGEDMPGGSPPPAPANDARRSSPPARSDAGADRAASRVRELLAKRDRAPSVALPTPSDKADADKPGKGAAATSGTAPATPPTHHGAEETSGQGRRAGAILVNRVGYLRPATDGAGVMFVFDADDADNPEPPVIVQPCRLLAEVENLLARRGQPVRLVISGEIQKYRGADYLLPTVIRLAPDRGNLQP